MHCRPDEFNHVPSPHTDIGFFLNGRLYPNNSEVVLTEIGEGYAALYCLTNLTTCCSESEGGMTGEWFLPGQTQPVIGDDAEGADSVDFVTSRAASAVLLNRKVNGSQTGTFTCWIPDESGENRTASIRVTGWWVINSLVNKCGNNLG